MALPELSHVPVQLQTRETEATPPRPQRPRSPNKRLSLVPPLLLVASGTGRATAARMDTPSSAPKPRVTTLPTAAMGARRHVAPGRARPERLKATRPYTPSASGRQRAGALLPALKAKVPRVDELKDTPFVAIRATT